MLKENPFYHFAKKTAKKLYSIKHIIAERDELQKKVGKLEEQISTLTKWGTPSYHSDYLCVWFKNLDFLQDEKFMYSYLEGVNSGHRIGGATSLSQDIHIEWRIHVCCWAASHAMQLEGDFVECGTNTGIMSLAICHYINFNQTGKNFYLFDTYCGIPDEQVTSEERAKGLHLQNTDYYDCYERAKQNFSSFPKAHLIRGKVPDTLGSQAIEKVCYLMLDMNIVHPEKAALEFFWDKLVSGALVLFDDYGWVGYIEQKRAHDAFAESKGVKILNLPTGQGLLIKP